MQQRFVYLDLLRFLFAMIVFFGHAQGLFVLQGFQLAVDYFFILSGFVLTYAYQGKVNSSSFFLNFVIDRIARLYPLHFVLLIILMAMNIWFTEMTGGHWIGEGWSYKDGRAYTLLLNFFLINNVGLTVGGTSWNAPAWSISVEFWINILFAGIAFWFRRASLWFFAALSLFSFLMLFNNFDGLGEFAANLHGWINSGLLRGMLGMSVGCVCYVIYSLLFPVLSRHKKWLFVFSVFLVFCQLWLMSGWWGQGLSSYLVIPLSGVTVIAVALAEPINASSFSSRCFIWLGECSYSVYMIHWLLIVFVSYFMVYAWKLDVDLKRPWDFFVLIIILLALSRISFILIEKPGRLLIRSLRV